MLLSSFFNHQDVIHCPRKICQLPVWREDKSNLVHCPYCQYAFCAICKRTYHGPTSCFLTETEKRDVVERYQNGSKETQERMEKMYTKKFILQAINENLSITWMEKNCKPCPKCGAKIEKTDGCNKMTCFKCGIYFCWLCRKSLSVNKPYAHFNDERSQCFMKLFPQPVDEEDAD